MRIEDHGMEYSRDGYKVRIGPVEIGKGGYAGRKRHFRRIFINDVEVHKSQGKSLDAARYHAGFELEYKMRMDSKLREQ